MPFNVINTNSGKVIKTFKSLKDAQKYQKKELKEYGNVYTGIDLAKRKNQLKIRKT